MTERKSRSAKFIFGIDLIKNNKAIEIPQTLVNMLDPGGVNVVIEEVGGDADLNLKMLFKVLDKEEPLEGRIKVPYDLFLGIVHKAVLGDTNVN